VPGVSWTLEVPANSVVVVAADGGIETSSAASTGFSIIDMALAVDGSFPLNPPFKRVIAANTTGLVQVIANWSFTQALTLPPGVHTLQVFTRGAGSGTSAIVSGDSSSVLQVKMTVTVLNQ
jgi:hypothetical protein